MFKCKNCGYTSIKWLGQCPKCNAWGTFAEVSEELESSDILIKSFTKSNKHTKQSNKRLDIIDPNDAKDKIIEAKRVSTGFKELDRILGKGGALQGAVTLVGGEPGIGKSTLLLQTLVNIAKKSYKVLYVSAEESGEQILRRLKRITKVIPKDLKILAELDLSAILSSGELKNFDFIVFDSIQAFIYPDVAGVIGGITQVKTTVSLITNYAKQHNIGVFLIGQVTKTGKVSGPKTVEHIVDTVLYLEYLGVGGTRIVRSVKNRFGEVGDVGFLEMTTKGFKDNSNAESLFVEQTKTNIPGASYGVIVHGLRPLIVQIQALLTDTQFSLPRRVVEGFPKNKIEVLAAVITQKMPKVSLANKDLFIKALGGMVLKDSGIDLAVIASIVSSVLEKPLDDAVFIGEVGLLGEIKPCIALDLRIKEARKLGFKKIYSFKNLKHIKDLLEII